MIQIPGYVLLHLLDQGGMAVVYLAVLQSLGREVALKVLSSSLAQDTNARERFLLEARVAANLHHRHIVPIHDVAMHEGMACIAMKLEPGGTVSQLAASCPQRRPGPWSWLTINRALAAMLMLAAATELVKVIGRAPGEAGNQSRFGLALDEMIANHANYEACHIAAASAGSGDRDQASHDCSARSRSTMSACSA